MPIRLQVQATLETILGFETAAEEKYEDGFNLMASNSPGNGVYLMGYAAEMLLKAAYFRFKGLPEVDPLTFQHLKQARQDARKVYGVAADDDNFHGIEFWGELLIKARQTVNRPLRPAVEGELDQRAKSLAANWYVDMRYHSLQIVQQDVEAVLDDVVWVKSNYETLWR